jgi:hypothetical protein
LLPKKKKKFVFGINACDYMNGVAGLEGREKINYELLPKKKKKICFWD